MNKNAYNKLYNIEWYDGTGKVQTTSAKFVDIIDAYLCFRYENGGLFVVEQKAIRSLQCVE